MECDEIIIDINQPYKGYFVKNFYEETEICGIKESKKESVKTTDINQPYYCDNSIKESEKESVKTTDINQPDYCDNNIKESKKKSLEVVQDESFSSDKSDKILHGYTTSSDDSLDEIILDSGTTKIRLSDKIEEKDYGLGWTQSSFEKFEEIMRYCELRSEYHLEAASYFNMWYRYFTYPQIILSTILTMTTTINTSFHHSHLSYSMAGISFLNNILSGFSSFCGYSSRETNHLSSHLQYSELARQITTELFLPINERNSVKYDFNMYSLLLQNIEGSEPPIPKLIIKRINRLVKKRNYIKKRKVKK